MITATKERYDLAIVGGGVFGLWAARAAVKAGLSCVLIEKGRIGAGSSGGVVGVLMPHVPERWNGKKAFQFAALDGLSSDIARLEAETDLETGYRRSGRLIPIVTEDKLAHARAREAEAKTLWKGGAAPYAFKVLEASPFAGWPIADAAPFGIIQDTLAAHLRPRGILKALRAAIASRCRIMEGALFQRFDEAAGEVVLANGSLLAERVVIASGVEAFGLIQCMTGQTIGRGEKGQAVLLKGKLPAGLPLVYDDGVYVVPHDDGTVAVGSTSERVWTDIDAHEADLAPLLAKAKRLCPALEGMEVGEMWAGIRPRANKRDPVLGLLPGRTKTYIAAGGFKIGFGIAHRLAVALIEEITGADRTIDVPETFRPAAHFASLVA